MKANSLFDYFPAELKVAFFKWASLVGKSDDASLETFLFNTIAHALNAEGSPLWMEDTSRDTESRKALGELNAILADLPLYLPDLLKPDPFKPAEQGDGSLEYFMRFPVIAGSDRLTKDGAFTGEFRMNSDWDVWDSPDFSQPLIRIPRGTLFRIVGECSCQGDVSVTIQCNGSEREMVVPAGVNLLS